MNSQVPTCYTVIPFPERTYRPDLPAIWSIIDDIRSDPSKLFSLAKWCLVQAIDQKDAEPPSPQRTQDITNILTLSAFCLFTLLGVPREDLDNVDLPPVA